MPLTLKTPLPFFQPGALAAALCLALTLGVSPHGLADSHAPAAAIENTARDAQIAEVMKVAGWHESYARLERSLRDRALADKRLRKMTKESRYTFSVTVRDKLNAKALLAEAAARLKTELAPLSDVQVQACLDTIKQALPQRMLALDRLANDQNEQAVLIRYKVALDKKAPPPARLALANRYLAASGIQAAYVQDQKAQLELLLTEAQKTLSEEELVEQTALLVPELEKRVRVAAQADTLALYREVSDEDLKTYVEMLEAPSVSDVLTRVTRVNVDVNQHATGILLQALADAVPPEPEAAKPEYPPMVDPTAQ